MGPGSLELCSSAFYCFGYPFSFQISTNTPEEGPEVSGYFDAPGERGPSGSQGRKDIRHGGGQARSICKGKSDYLSPDGKSHTSERRDKVPDRYPLRSCCCGNSGLWRQPCCRWRDDPRRLFLHSYGHNHGLCAPKKTG